MSFNERFWRLPGTMYLFYGVIAVLIRGIARKYLANPKRWNFEAAISI